ncbi:hypothetical protein XELAEV_18002329mg [Xenopus laevis]|nr:hypothetical protein XELAEV_18002329mg [Xenopus laevis]
MLRVGASVPFICFVSGLILQSDWFPSSHEAPSSLIPLDASLSNKLGFWLHPMIGADVLFSCIDSETVIIVKLEMFPSSHEAGSSLIPLAGGVCSAGDISGFVRFLSTLKSAPSPSVLLGSLL